MWNQVYDPFSNQTLSTIAAALPVVTLLVLIASGKVKAHIAAIIALIVANLITIGVYNMPANMSVRASILITWNLTPRALKPGCASLHSSAERKDLIFFHGFGSNMENSSSAVVPPSQPVRLIGPHLPGFCRNVSRSLATNSGSNNLFLSSRFKTQNFQRAKAPVVYFPLPQWKCAHLFCKNVLRMFAA